MAALDDLPLATGHGETTEMAPSAPSSPGPRVVWFGMIAALAIGAGVWYYAARQPASDGQPGAAATATAAGTEARPGAPPVTPVLPPLEQMDPYVRELLATLGSHPELLKWLATDDLVASIVTAVDRLAQGQSPGRDLAVLRPAAGFGVVRRSDVTQIDPASHARYSALVTAATAVDPAALATAFTTLRPRLEEAYVAQGHPAGGFGEAVRRAIEVVASTPDVPADAALVPGVGGYAYADPAFERLPPAQKHLVRMGPDQVRRVRDAARRLGDALAAAGAPR